MDDYVSDSESTHLLRPNKGEEDGGHTSEASSSYGQYSSINAAGPQLCYSPPTPYNVSSANTPTTSIQSEYTAEEFKLYDRRWYILIVFSLIAATQSGVWNTFGPISTSSEYAFGWDDSTIALLTNWGPIAYLLVGIPFSWMMDVKGLRLSCLITAFLIALGTALRCITTDTPAVTWLMHVGQLLNGLAGPVAMAGPVVVSAVWFPPHQRTTATAIGNVFAAAGNAVSFLLGPYLVPDVPLNGTGVDLGHSQFSGNQNIEVWSDQLLLNGSHHSRIWQDQNSSTPRTPEQEKKDIRLFMYVEAAWSIALFLVVLIYFPKKPPLPPCASAAIQREDFFRGVKNLFRQPQFWVVCAVYGISTGVQNCWASVLNIILKPHGIGEHEAGWIGFYGSCASIFSSVLVSWLADHLKRVMKWMVIGFYFICVGCYLVFTLATINVVPASTVLIYITTIVGGMALSAAVPLMFEMACELAYPTGEGTANGVLTIINNFFGLIFLFILMIPNLSSSWTNWSLVGACAVCLPLLLLMKEQYNRLDIDEHNPSLTAEIIIVTPSQNSVVVPPQSQA